MKGGGGGLGAEEETEAVRHSGEVMIDLEQLCYFISGVMRRIHGIPLDKAGDRSFKYMSPENRAEKGRDGLHETATQTEKKLCRTPPSSNN